MKHVIRGLCLLLCAGLLLSAAGGFAALADAPAPTFYYDEWGDGTISVVGYDGELPQKLTIPKKIDGKTVTEISWNAFSGTEITQLTIPEGVTAILDYAFGNCASLETVTLPSTLESIGSGAFSDCVCLKKIALPEGLTNLGEYVFSGCVSMTSAVLPKGLKEISNNAFNGCEALKAIELPPALQYLGVGAFACCAALTSVVLPAKLETVGEEAFGWCTSLKTVAFPEGLIGISNRAFIDCEALTAPELPSTLEWIGYDAFYGCTGLKTVHLPASVFSVDPDAFLYCASLTALTVDKNNRYYAAKDGVLYDKDLTELIVYPTGKPGASFRLPDSVRTVWGRNAFSDTALTKLDLNRAESISPGALARSGIATLTKAADNKALSIRDNVLYNEDGTVLLGYPGGLTAASFTVPGQVTVIEDSAFRGNRSLKKVVLPEGLRELRYMAFAASDVEEAALPASLRLLEEGAFADCTGLKKTNIPAGITVIPYDAFRGCGSLREVALPAGVKTIESYAFAWCANLKKATFSNGLERIEESAFFGCEALTGVKIPDSVCYIGSEAFDETGWMSARPDGPVYLGKVLYKYNGELPEGSALTVKAGTVMISPYAFAWQWGLADLTVPDSVRYVGAEAVVGTEWYEVALPEGPIYMGKAFYGYKGTFSGTSFALKEGTFSATPDAFWPLETVLTLSLPASLTELEVYDLLALPKLEAVNAAKDNKVFASENGVLYSKDKKELLLYPAGKKDKSFEIPYGVERLGTFAFYGNDHLQKLTVHTDLKDAADSRDGCALLEHVYYSGVRRTWDDIRYGEDLLADSKLHFTHEEVFKETATSILVAPGCLVGDVTRTLNEAKGLPVKRPDGNSPKESDNAGTGMTVATASGNKTVLLMGDADGDGKITSADARSALRYSVSLDKPTAWQTAACRVTGGAKVTSADARMILRASVGLEDPMAWYRVA